MLQDVQKLCGQNLFFSLVSEAAVLVWLSGGLCCRCQAHVAICSLQQGGRLGHKAAGRLSSLVAVNFATWASPKLVAGLAKTSKCVEGGCRQAY